MTTFGILPNIGLPEMILLILLALIIFGPAKLPEIGKAMGKSVNEFKNAMKSQNLQEECVIEEQNQKEQV